MEISDVQNRIAEILADEVKHGQCFDLDAYLDKKEIFNNVIRILGNEGKMIPTEFKINDSHFKQHKECADGKIQFSSKCNGYLEILQITVDLTKD